MKNTNVIIICKSAEGGTHNFYLVVGSVEYFLFSEGYKKSVYDYYSKGVRLKDASNYSKSKRNVALMKTMSKIPMYVRYLEKEYDLEILEKTKKRNRGHYGRTFVRYA